MYRIGIPRALAYHAYGGIWCKYFSNLGCEVLVSPPTNKAMVDDGTRETVGEACIPVKIFHGHVIWFGDKVDYIFIPRLRNVDEECNVTFCPKFLGLPDLVKVSIPNVPEILSPDIVLHGKRSRLLYIAAILARRLGKSYWQGVRAMAQALAQGTASHSLKSKSAITFAIAGYPYFLHDDFLNFKIHKKLESSNIDYIYSDAVAQKELNRFKGKIPKSLFWEFSNKVLLATYYFLEELKVDGIIHLTAFACGPDAMVGKLIELECKERNVPFLDLTIDEHTGEAGIQTRVEAFIDMFNLRREGT